MVLETSWGEIYKLVRIFKVTDHKCVSKKAFKKSENTSGGNWPKRASQSSKVLVSGKRCWGVGICRAHFRIGRVVTWVVLWELKQIRKEE